jgi:hypothetical protein
MIDQLVLIVLSFGITGFAILANRNLITLLAMFLQILFLFMVDFSYPHAPFNVFFIVICILVLAVKFYTGIRD